MKYLTIFFLSFCIFTQAQAAKQVSGTVPELKPLQPPPEGVELDYANILNSPPDESAEQSIEDNTNIMEKKPGEYNTQDITDKSGKFNFLNSKTNGYGLVIIGLIVLAGGTFYIIRGKRKF